MSIPEMASSSSSSAGGSGSSSSSVTKGKVELVKEQGSGWPEAVVMRLKELEQVGESDGTNAYRIAQ